MAHDRLQQRPLHLRRPKMSRRRRKIGDRAMITGLATTKHVATLNFWHGVSFAIQQRRRSPALPSGLASSLSSPELAGVLSTMGLTFLSQ